MYYYNQNCFTGGITGNMTKDRDFCLGIKFGFRINVTFMTYGNVS